MTKRQAAKVYQKIDPVEWAQADRGWKAEAVAVVLEVAHAKTYQKAVAILRDHSWGDPEGCAQDIRGTKRCPTCKGCGVVETKA